MDNVRIVLSTIDSVDNAQSLAHQLVRRRLAACVNIVPQVQSVYRWQGRIESDPEVLLVLKTTDSCLPQLQAELDKLHPYDTPEIVSFVADKGSQSYFDWVVEQTSRPD